MASIKGRVDRLRREAARHDLYVGTYSPGDGITRYRFFKSPGGRPVPYFSQDGLYTALGLKQAEAWLSGYRRW